MHRIDNKIVDNGKDRIRHDRELVLRHKILQVRYVGAHVGAVERRKSGGDIVRVHWSVCHVDAGLDWILGVSNIHCSRFDYSADYRQANLLKRSIPVAQRVASKHSLKASISVSKDTDQKVSGYTIQTERQGRLRQTET